MSEPAAPGPGLPQPPQPTGDVKVWAQQLVAWWAQVSELLATKAEVEQVRRELEELP